VKCPDPRRAVRNLVRDFKLGIAFARECPPEELSASEYLAAENATNSAFRLGWEARDAAQVLLDKRAAEEAAAAAKRPSQRPTSPPPPPAVEIPPTVRTKRGFPGA